MNSVAAKAILAAEAEREQAWQSLDRAVAVAFPVGARVRVLLGRHYVEGTVTSTHDSDHWSDYEAGYVYIANDATGKGRKFHAPSRIESDQVEVLSVP